MDRDAAMAVAARAAADSMPPQYLSLLSDVGEHPVSRTAEVARRLRMPWRTADRALQELGLLGCLTWDTDGSDKWIYSPAAGVADLVKSIARKVSTP